MRKHELVRNTKNSIQKIIRFDNNIDKKIYINFCRVNWCKMA
jgi:hypothetical protein